MAADCPPSVVQGRPGRLAIVLGAVRARGVPIAVGLILIVAALLKTHQLATEELREQTFLTSRVFLTLLVLYETALAVGLLSGIAPGLLRWLAIITFAVFFEVSLYQGVMKYGGCGCLGKVHVSPWVMLAVDSLVLAALVLWKPSPSVGRPLWDPVRLGLAAVFYAWLVFPLLMHIAYYAPTGIMYRLRNDERLRVFVTLDYKEAPTSEELLTTLEQATGLRLSLHPRLEFDPQRLGPLKAKNIPVWSVMENLALTQKLPARWDQVPGGYELRPAAPLGHAAVPWLLSALGAAGTAAIYLFLRQKRHTVF